MKLFLYSSAALAILSACGSTSAANPDPKNPAHCVAAFHYGRELMLTGDNPDYKVAIGMSGRALFEMKRIPASELQTSREVGGDILQNYEKNTDVMNKLLLDCRANQNADPSFQAADKSGAIMAAARKIDPICKNDQACLAGKKY